jgi:hypothetical protein|tara:strand:+ start:183 stop:2087 length:1905 start_codon:yes stop_codon:yes gene_type:complete
MSEELPSVNDFIEDRSNFSSVESITEENLPSYKDFIETKEEIIHEEVEPQVEQRQDNTEIIVSLIESVRNSIPEVKSYDKELYELVQLIEEVRKEIPVVPEPPEFPEIPEVRYYDEQIDNLQEQITEVKERDIPDFRWISKSFSSINDDYESVSSSLAQLKGKLDLEINNLVETIEVNKFERDVDTKNLNEKVSDVSVNLDSRIQDNDRIIREDINKIKNKIYNNLRETSLRIWNLNKEYKSEDKKLKAYVNDQYELLTSSIGEVLKESDTKYDKVIKYFDNLREEVKALPEVKYYDEEIDKVNQSVKSVQNLVEVLENKLNKKIAGLKESILVVPPTENNTDPLTPLDQNFATLDDLSSHYRLFLNRIQQQLATLGGGGETRLEFLDDLDRDTALVDGKFLKYQASTGTFVGAAAGGSYSGTTGQLLQHDGSDYVGVSSVGVATFFNDHHQGYYRYSTHFYSAGIANTVQTLPADEFVLIQPSVRTNRVRFLPEKMLLANNNDPWVGSGATVGSGQTEFSLAGLDDGSTVIVRIAAQFNPDIDNTNLDFALNFTTNPTTQSFGTTHFSVTREQALICNEGADQNYISETLINFYVGNSLSGMTTDTAGSFNISARASDEGDFEMMALTINVVA